MALTYIPHPFFFSGSSLDGDLKIIPTYMYSESHNLVATKSNWNGFISVSILSTNTFCARNCVPTMCVIHVAVYKETVHRLLTMST